MAEPYLFQLSMQKAGWLSARQAVIAANVANASTPGYRASDVRPFSQAIEQTALRPVTSSPLHMASISSFASDVRIAGETPWATYHSGANVNLDQEMIKAADVSASYRLNTSVLRTFHQMILTVAGG